MERATAVATPPLSVAACQDVFSSMDKNKDGKISKQEFIAAMLAKGLGKTMPPQQAAQPAMKMAFQPAQSATYGQGDGSLSSMSTQASPLAAGGPPQTLPGRLSSLLQGAIPQTGAQPQSQPPRTLPGAAVSSTASPPARIQRTASPPPVAQMGQTLPRTVSPPSVAQMGQAFSYAAPQGVTQGSPAAAAPQPNVQMAASPAQQPVAAPMQPYGVASEPVATVGYQQGYRGQCGQTLGQGTASSFDALDRNHDGVITRAEFAGMAGGVGGTMAPATTGYTGAGRTMSPATTGYTGAGGTMAPATTGSSFAASLLASVQAANAARDQYSAVQQSSASAQHTPLLGAAHGGYTRQTSESSSAIASYAASLLASVKAANSAKDQSSLVQPTGAHGAPPPPPPPPSDVQQASSQPPAAQAAKATSDRVATGHAAAKGAASEVPTPPVVQGNAPAIGKLEGSSCASPYSIGAYRQTQDSAENKVVMGEMDGRQVNLHFRGKPTFETIETHVPVTRVELQKREEEVPLTLKSETIEFVPEVQTVELVQEYARDPEYREVPKSFEVPVYASKENIVEVPMVVTQEVLTEVPQYYNVELTKEVVKPAGTRVVQKEVHVPVYKMDQVREKHIEVPQVTIKDNLLVIPDYQAVDILKQEPGPEEVQKVQKEVGKPTVELREHIEVVHCTDYYDQITEVPEIEVIEIIKQVPKVEVRYYDRYVDVPKVEYVEKIEEIPMVIYEERVVEVPEVEIREVLKQVVREDKQYLSKEVPNHMMKYLEHIQTVELPLTQEYQVEGVTEVIDVELVTQVPKATEIVKPKEIPRYTGLQQKETVDYKPIPVEQQRLVEVPKSHEVLVVTQVPKVTMEVRTKEVPKYTGTEHVPVLQEIHVPLRREKGIEAHQDMVYEAIREEIDEQVQQKILHVPKEVVEYRQRLVEVSPGIGAGVQVQATQQVVDAWEWDFQAAKEQFVKNASTARPRSASPPPPVPPPIAIAEASPPPPPPEPTTLPPPQPNVEFKYEDSHVDQLMVEEGSRTDQFIVEDVVQADYLSYASALARFLAQNDETITQEIFRFMQEQAQVLNMGLQTRVKSNFPPFERSQPNSSEVEYFTVEIFIAKYEEDIFQVAYRSASSADVQRPMNVIQGYLPTTGAYEPIVASPPRAASPPPPSVPSVFGFFTGLFSGDPQLEDQDDVAAMLRNVRRGLEYDQQGYEEGIPLSNGHGSSYPPRSRTASPIGRIH